MNRKIKGPAMGVKTAGILFHGGMPVVLFMMGSKPSNNLRSSTSI